MHINSRSAFRPCTSCQMCAAVCPYRAIRIEMDAEGFYRPVVDEALCRQCSLCTKVCYKFDPDICKTSANELADKPLYAAWANDDEIVRNTSSGGIADLLARELMATGYKVAGCIYNDGEARAEHKIASTKEELDAFRGSKYIQSYTFDALKDIVSGICSEKYAVFGTPCQIYALRKWASMKNVQDRFLLVDFYCHGCPSLHVWRKYQDYIKCRTGFKHFDKVVFRSKTKGWGSFYVVVVVDGVPVFKSNPREDGFYELFFSDMALNEGCHACKLCGTLEYTDIRLGDFWGKKFLGNRRGVSAVSLVTESGKSAFNRIQDRSIRSNVSIRNFCRIKDGRLNTRRIRKQGTRSCQA